METEEYNQPVNYPSCLICSSSVITPDIKVELPCLDEDDDDDGKLSVIIFVLAAILEIPQNEVIKRKEKLTNKQLSTLCYCESCTKLIYSAKQIYKEILEITRKFRSIQKEIVDRIYVSKDLPYCTIALPGSIHDYILSFCRKFQNKNVLNGFGYPFVVNEIPVKKSSSPLPPPPDVDNVKEEPVSVSENEEEDDNCGMNENDEDDYFQDATSTSSADHNDDQNESDSDFEPEPPRKLIKKESPTKSIRSVIVEADEDQDVHKVEEDNFQDSTSPSADDDNSVSQTESETDSEPPPPPRKAVKKVTIKKPPLSSSTSAHQKGNRKSPSSSAPLTSTSKKARVTGKEKKPKKQKPVRKKKTSRFDRLYPNYPTKRLRNPTTKLFHCSEPSCSKSYKRKTRLETHIMIAHLQDNYYKCEEPSCGKSYANPEHYQDHVSWHAGIPRWKCEEKVNVKVNATTTSASDTLQCPEAFYCRRALNRHVQAVHHSDKPFICEFCGAKFNCQDNLTCHKYAKHKDKGKKAGVSINCSKSEPQICDYCGKSYSGKNALQVHINLVHDNSVGKFGCKFCDHKFLISTHLKMHMFRKHNYSLDGFQMKKMHIGRRRFQCNVYRCKMRFSKEETFKKHMEEKHGDGKEDTFEFHCKFCGMGFHLKNKFEFHEEAHENRESKPFGCEICGKRFATLPYLKIHRKNIHKIPMEHARKPME